MREQELIRRLRKFYGPRSFFSAQNDPFKILLSTILSQRTRDSNTREAEERLFSRYPTASSLAKAPTKEIERLIKSTGFYRAKARHIKEVAKVIIQRFGGKVPSDRESLLTLPGVGPKTANCVLVYAFKKPAIPVDVHVHRVANRLGWVRTKTPEKTEEALCSLLPRSLWIELNELFVTHGRRTCLPRNPRCSKCPVEDLCEKRVGKSEKEV